MSTTGDARLRRTAPPNWPPPPTGWSPPTRLATGPLVAAATVATQILATRAPASPLANAGHRRSGPDCVATHQRVRRDVRRRRLLRCPDRLATWRCVLPHH